MSLNLPDTGLSPQELKFGIERGGRFVVFQYCVSALIITFRRNTSVQFIKAGESAAIKSLPYTLLSLVLGWWGIPWGSTPRRSSTRTSTAASMSHPPYKPRSKVRHRSIDPSGDILQG